MTTFDVLLWSVAAMLFAFAAWLHTRDDDDWSPAEWLVAAWCAVRGSVPPVTGGAVPAEGWDGVLDELPASLHPMRRLAHGLDWTDLAGPRARDAALRRLDGVSLVWLEAPGVPIEGMEVTHVSCDTDMETLRTGIEERLRAPSDRVILAASTRAMDLLRLLHAAPGLRDRTRAVLLTDAALDADWLAAHLDHLAFDTELLRTLPILQITTPASPTQAPVLLPEPPPPPNGRRSLELVHLGGIAPADRHEPALARAMLLVLAAVGG